MSQCVKLAQLAVQLLLQIDLELDLETQTDLFNRFKILFKFEDSQIANSETYKGNILFANLTIQLSEHTYKCENTQQLNFIKKILLTDIALAG